MTQHASLTVERWRQFTLDQQILMIANEMNRGSKVLAPGDDIRRRNTYERTLALVDLTIRVNEARGLRQGLLRWRDLVADLYIAEAGNADAHAAALRVLLRLTPEVSKQIPHLGTGAHQRGSE